MRAKINLSVEKSLLERIQAYAREKQTSVSQLVEDYFASIARPPKRKSIIEVVDRMKKPVPSERKLKEEYYKDIEKKYGA